MALNNDEKRELDHRIDAGWPKTVALTDGSHAVLTILRAAEYRTQTHDFAIDEAYGTAASTVAAADITREAIHFAIKIAHESGNLTSRLGFGITETDLVEAITFLRKAADYSEMCDIMTNCWLDGVSLEQNSAGEYIFRKSPTLINYEAAEWLWLGIGEQDDVPAPNLELRSLETWFNNAGNLPGRPEQVIFRLPIEILKGIKGSMKVYSDRQWQVPDSLSMGEFDLTQFRELWPAILACAVVPKILFKATKLINIAIPIGSRDAWISLLTEITDLEDTIISRLIDFMTYSVETTREGKNSKTADVSSQPFFRVGDELALSSCLSIGSSSERNFLGLVANKLSRVYDGLKKQKEEQWSRELAQSFRNRGLHAVFQKTFFENKKAKGDIDAFIYDSTEKVALVVQLKWFLVDRVKSAHLEQARDGVRQAVEATEWISNNPDKAAVLLGVPSEDIREMKLLPLTVLKEGLVQGFAQDGMAPVISDKIFGYYIDACEGKLGRIWQNASKKTFLPVEGTHYSLVLNGIVPSSGQPFNGVRFRKHVIFPKEQFIPMVD